MLEALSLVWELVSSIDMRGTVSSDGIGTGFSQKVSYLKIMLV